MKHKKFYIIKTFLAACVLFVNSCSGASTANALSSKTVLVGSTPGDALIKTLLAINPESRIDFIRWDLSLNEAENGSKNFVLNIVFGEGEPNTRAFKGGGEKLSFEGVYAISKSRKGEIYELKSKTPATTISLVKLNENLFHLLTPDKKLMVGTGGWSYTLSRKDASAKSSALPSWTASLPGTADEQLIFDGRTPCLDFALRDNLGITNDCLKLKWRLTLFKDSKTNKPTKYTLEGTQYRRNKVEGNWTIIKGTKSNSEAIIYQLNPERPDESMSFLVGDENVLFFLDKDYRLLAGNEDFSFTLNRRQ